MSKTSYCVRWCGGRRLAASVAIVVRWSSGPQEHSSTVRSYRVVGESARGGPLEVLVLLSCGIVSLTRAGVYRKVQWWNTLEEVLLLELGCVLVYSARVYVCHRCAAVVHPYPQAVRGRC